MIQQNGQSGGAAGKIILLFDQMSLVQFRSRLDIRAQMPGSRSRNGQVDFRLGLFLQRINT